MPHRVASAPRSQAHYDFTESAVAWRILSGWKEYAKRFAKVMPVEYRQILKAAHLDSEAAKSASV